MSDNIDNKSQEGAIDRTGNEGQESVPDRPLTALEISARNAMMADLGEERVEDRLVQLEVDHDRVRRPRVPRGPPITVAPPRVVRTSQNEKAAKQQTEKLAKEHSDKINQWKAKSTQFDDILPQDRNGDSLSHGDLHRGGRSQAAGPYPGSQAELFPAGPSRRPGRGVQGVGIVGEDSEELKVVGQLLHKTPDRASDPDTAAAPAARGVGRGVTNREGRDTAPAARGVGRGVTTNRQGRDTAPAARGVGRGISGRDISQRPESRSSAPSTNALIAPARPAARPARQAPVVNYGFGLASQDSFMSFVPGVVTTPGVVGTAPVGASVLSPRKENENVQVKKPAQGGLANSRYNLDNAPTSSASNQKENVPLPSKSTAKAAVEPAKPDIEVSRASSLPTGAKLPSVYFRRILFAVDTKELGQGTVSIDVDMQSGAAFVTVTLDSGGLQPPVPVFAILKMKIVKSTIYLYLGNPPPGMWALTAQLPCVAGDLEDLIKKYQSKSPNMFTQNAQLVEAVEPLIDFSESTEEPPVEKSPLIDFGESTEEPPVEKSIENEFEEEFDIVGLDPLFHNLLVHFRKTDLQPVYEKILRRKLAKDYAELLARTLKVGIERSKWGPHPPTVPQPHDPHGTAQDSGVTEADVELHLREISGVQDDIPAALVTVVTKMLVKNKKESLRAQNDLLIAFPPMLPQVSGTQGSGEQSTEVATRPRKYATEELLALQGHASRIVESAVPLIPQEWMVSSGSNVSKSQTDAAPKGNANPAPVKSASVSQTEISTKLDQSAFLQAMETKRPTPSANSMHGGQANSEMTDKTKVTAPSTTAKRSEPPAMDQSPLPPSAGAQGTEVNDKIAQVPATNTEQTPPNNLLSPPADPIFYQFAKAEVVEEVKERKSGLETSRWATADDNIAGADSMTSSQTCKYFPNYKNPNCKYAHPKEKPTCKYDPFCANPNCAYDHPSAMKTPTLTKKATQTDVECRYWPHCARQNCPYGHPWCRFDPCLKPKCNFRHQGDATSSMASSRTSYATAAEEADDLSVSNLDLNETTTGTSGGLMTPRPRGNTGAASSRPESPQVLRQVTLRDDSGNSFIAFLPANQHRFPNAELALSPGLSASTSRRSNQMLGTSSSLRPRGEDKADEEKS